MVTAARLRRSIDIARARAEGRPGGDHAFRLWVRDNDTGTPRLAVSTQRSFGDAVARNRARRRLREAVRVELRERSSLVAVDLVLTARSAIVHTVPAALRAGVRRELDRLERTSA